MRKIRFADRREYDSHLSAAGQVSIFPHVFNGDFESHTHDYLELLIVRKGTARHRVNGEECILRPGDVYVLGEGVSHTLIGAQQLDIYNIGFRSNFGGLLGDDVKKMPGYQALFVIAPSSSLTGFKATIRLQSSNLARIDSIISRMLGEISNRTAGNETLVSLFAMELIIRLSSIYTSGETSFMNAIDPLAKAVGYMEAHWNSPVTIETLAKKFGSSVRHFDRVFKSHYRKTPFSYLLDLRIKRAEEMLSHSNRSVTEVAFDCGFSDSNYFSRQFKKITGRRPKDLRKDRTNERVDSCCR